MSLMQCQTRTTLELSRTRRSAVDRYYYETLKFDSAHAECYFLKSIKSVFILVVHVQCNTSLSKNYVAHSIPVVCVIGWIWEKKCCLCSLAVCAYSMKSVVEQGFSHEFTFNDKALKTFLEFQICWKCSKFEWIVKFEFALCHMPRKEHDIDGKFLPTCKPVCSLLRIDDSVARAA